MKRITLLALAVPAVLAVAAEPRWAFPDGVTSPTAAVLTAAPAACRAEIVEQLRDLQGKLPVAEIAPTWFTTTPYVSVQVDGQKYGFHLMYDEFDQRCELVDRRIGLLRALPSCPCTYADPARAALPRGEHASLLRVNGLLKAFAEGCAQSASPQAAGVAEYRRTLRFYFTYKTRVPELVKQPTRRQRRDAWEFGKALAALESNDVDEQAYQEQRGGLPKAGPELDAICAGAANSFADKIAAMVMEVKAFEHQHKVTLERPVAADGMSSTGARPTPP